MNVLHPTVVMGLGPFGAQVAGYVRDRLEVGGQLAICHAEGPEQVEQALEEAAAPLLIAGRQGAEGRPRLDIFMACLAMEHEDEDWLKRSVEAATRLISTRYANKRRWLRNHRAQMRVVQEVIEQHDLEDEVEDRVVEETGNNCYWLGFDSDMDESSDAEDPEAKATEELTAAKQELEDRSALIEALTDRAQRERIVQDLERERMARADLEGRLSWA